MTKARSSRKLRKKIPGGARGPQAFTIPRRPSADRAQGTPIHFDWRCLLVLLVIAAGVFAYYSSFDGKLVFDDEKHITDNQRIRDVYPLSETMNGRRPLVDLSLAINRHYGLKDDGLDLWGFHAFNLGVHLLAGLTLFGIVRLTILRGPFNERVQAAAPWFALAVATIWVVHPLQTQSVTYLIQRGESMMGLCYLLTLYGVVRGASSKYAPLWYASAVMACAVGMGCKAIIVTAPLVVLIYDRVFLSKSLSELLSRRWLLYLGLTATFSVLFFLGVVGGVLSTDIKGATVGFSVPDVTPLVYLVSQPGVIAYYFKLSFWPHPLCLDYNWPVAQRFLDVLLPALVIVPLIAGTIWGFLRKPWVGFVGAWFFIILAPTSSFIPIKDLLFEHRMYLPLAAIIVIVVALAYRALIHLSEQGLLQTSGRRTFGTILVIGVVASLTYATFQRNTDYHDALGMWRDVIEKRPKNHRAHLGYGTAVFALGEQARDDKDRATARQHFIDAESAFREAVRLKKSYADAWYNLGNALNENEKPTEAIAAYRTSMQFKSRNAKSHYNLANVLKDLKRYDEAITEYRIAIDCNRNHIQAHVNLANTYKLLRRFDEAVAIYLKALQINAEHANTHHNLGDAYFLLGRYDEALSEFHLAMRYNPDHKQAKRGRDATLAKLRGE